MTRDAVPKAPRRGALALAWLATLAPLACASDWAWSWKWLLPARFVPIETTLSTAFCLALLAGGLALGDWPRRSCASKTRIAVACLVLAVCFGIAIEYATGATWMDLNQWQRGEGRMTVLALAGSALAACALIAIQLGKARLSSWCSLAVGACGAAGLLSHAVNLDYLYSFPQTMKIPTSTSLCLVLLSLALWASWRSEPRTLLGDDKVEASQILATLDFLLIALVATVSVAAFGFSQSHSEDIMRDQITVTGKARRVYFQNELNARATLASQLAKRPAVAKALREFGSARDGVIDRRGSEPFSASARSLISDGFSYFAYLDETGSLVASAGQAISKPEQSLPVTLSRHGSFTLLWGPEGYILKSIVPLLDGVVLAGYVDSEQLLAELTQTHMEGVRQGRTGDMVVCGKSLDLGSAKHGCFPFRWGSSGIYPSLLDGKPLPLTRAIAGEESTEITTDFRRQRVMVAFGPIGSTGLAMSTKMDMSELYAPIREQLFWSVPFMSIFIVLGMWLVRWRLHPLIQALELSRVELREMATHDGLTRLPNRTLFNDRLAHCLARGKRNKQLMALLYLDLDKFKEINDTHGHKVGDEALRWFAGHLLGCVRACDTVARLGGDEFCIILDNISQPSDADAVARKIHDRIAISAQDWPIPHLAEIHTSIGVAHCRHGAKTAEDLLAEADSALYLVKKNRR